MIYEWKMSSMINLSKNTVYIKYVHRSKDQIYNKIFFYQYTAEAENRITVLNVLIHCIFSTVWVRLQKHCIMFSHLFVKRKLQLNTLPCCSWYFLSFHKGITVIFSPQVLNYSSWGIYYSSVSLSLRFMANFSFVRNHEIVLNSYYNCLIKIHIKLF